MKKLLNVVLLFTLFYSKAYGQGSTAFTFIHNDATYDFGEIHEGSSSTYKFEFRNTGSNELSITGVKSDNAHLQFKWPEKPVKPGKKDIITVSYVTKDGDGIGSFKNDIYITSSATQAPYPFLHVKGSVTPPQAAMIPKSFDTSTAIKIPLSKHKHKAKKQDAPAQ